jgi:hypothetical protein
MSDGRAELVINISCVRDEPLRARVGADDLVQTLVECREAFLERIAAAAKPMLLNWLRQSVKTQEAAFEP